MLRKGIRKTAKWVLSPSLKKKYEKYSSKDHDIHFMGMDLQVKAGIFHPKFFFSTKTIIEFLKTKELQQLRLLELGCGSGAISVWAAKHGAIVTASDINENAVENAKANATKNKVEMECLVSDLFENLTSQPYDYIIINPPYYPNKASSMSEKAWFCGEDFEYFHLLFRQLKTRNEKAQIFMVLSEDCNWTKIAAIAADNFFEFNVVFERKLVLEKNSIIEIGHS